MAACTTATPAPSPRLSPPPEALDVVIAFEELVAAPTFAGQAESRVEITVGGEQAALITAVHEFAGSDGHTTATYVSGSSTKQIETIVVDGESVASADQGPWLVQTGEITSILPDILRGLDSLVDVGLETIDGVELHHLAPADSDALDLGALLGVANDVSDIAGTVDVYVRQDGTPVQLSIRATFSKDIDGNPTSHELTQEYAIEIGPAPEIALPVQIWETYASTAFPYSMAYPTTWSVEPSSGDASDANDVFRDGSRRVQGCDRIVIVNFYPRADAPLAEWLSDAAKLFADGTPPEFSDPIEVAGFAGRLFRVHSTLSDCGKVHLQQASFLQDGRAWDVLILSPAGDEDADRQLLDQFLLTFEPTTEPAGGSQGSSRLADLPVGTCFDPGADFDILGFVSFEDRTQWWFGARDAVAVPCDQPHGYEVIAIIPAGTGRQDCNAEFAAYVGRPFAESELGYVLMLPHDDEQTAGIPFVCAVNSPDGLIGTQPMTGSVKNSNR